MMKSKRELELEDRFARENGKNIRDDGGDSARVLGILIGLCLGAAVGFGLYGIAKLLG